MAKKSSGSNPNSKRHPPLGISTKDWENTPVSVRELLDTYSDREKLETGFSTWLTLILNLAVVIALTLAFVGKVKLALPCIAHPEVGAFSIALTLLIFFHFIWRNVHTLVPPNMNEKVNLGIIQFPFSIAVTFCNGIHPWKLSVPLLGILLLVFSIASLFLNLNTDSPLRAGGDPPVVQSFSVQRLDQGSPERLPPNSTLTVSAGENVFVETLFLGNVDASCTWFVGMSNEITKSGCSTILNIPPGVKRDFLTVSVRSVCGKRQTSASLHIATQP